MFTVLFQPVHVRYVTVRCVPAVCALSLGQKQGQWCPRVWEQVGWVQPVISAASCSEL